MNSIGGDMTLEQAILEARTQYRQVRDRLDTCGLLIRALTEHREKLLWAVKFLEARALSITIEEPHRTDRLPDKIPHPLRLGEFGGINEI